MCLINFQLHAHPKYKLVVAANRDEFYGRPTAPAAFWEDEPNLLAGRDLLGMGTWLGITKSGRFAALTNYRDPSEIAEGKISRGEIVRDFLTGDMHAEEYLKELHENKDRYNGFNLIVGTPDELYYYSNIAGKVEKVQPGTHGLSNHLLDTPWPKVVKGTTNLRKYAEQNADLAPKALFEILANAEQASDEELPETGVGIDLERSLSSLFIRIPDYGTRCSTVVLVDQQNQVTFSERTYENGEFVKDRTFSFQIEERSFPD
ncbi:NRDE family protein [Chungangia koreensis]|uniref:NRDE family protein n=1 Tax=Chungangia koreensis TaxID=752657 RepID=A0ABV8X1F9_9LACT